MHEQRNHRKNQQNVNQKSRHMEKHKPARPQNHQEYRQSQKRSESHIDASSTISPKRLNRTSVCACSPTPWNTRKDVPGKLKFRSKTRRSHRTAANNFSACSAPSGVSSCLKYTNTSPAAASFATRAFTAACASAE